MKNYIPILFFIFIGCAAPKYVMDSKQAGLLEPVILEDDCTLIGIDTVYNPLGGVLKVIHLKCKEQKGHK